MEIKIHHKFRNMFCIHAGAWYFCADVSNFILFVYAQKLPWKKDLKKKKKEKRGEGLRGGFSARLAPLAPPPALDPTSPSRGPAGSPAQQPALAFPSPFSLSLSAGPAWQRAPPSPSSSPSRTRNRVGSIPFSSGSPSPTRNQAL